MSETPSYSPEPGHNERRLGITAQTGHAQSGTFGTLLQHGDGIIIALKNQGDGARRATYGRNASLAGEMSLSNTQGITAVSVHFEGKVLVNFGATRISELKLFRISSTLWQAGASGACPTAHSFGFVFPENFTDSVSGTSYPLPPSYDPLNDSVSLQDLLVRCTYRLSVHIVRPRWMPDKAMNVDIDYAPRTVPPKSLMDTPFPFYNTIRSSPDEWWKTSVVMTVSPHAALEPIHCDLFIPSVRIFAKHDVIPIFLQLRGTSFSISALYSAENQEQGLARRLLSISRSSSNAPKILLTLQRQVTARTTGGEIARSYTIGTAALRSVPPGYTPPEMNPDMFTVDYEGEIKLASNVSVGGFNIGAIRVSDFIELSIRPFGVAANQFATVVHSVPVRIVTG